MKYMNKFILFITICVHGVYTKPSWFNTGDIAGLNFNKRFGPNLSGSASLFGPVRGGPLGVGAGLNYQSKPFGGSVSASSIPGVSNTFTGSGTANLFTNSNNKLDLNANIIRNQPFHGKGQTQVGGSLDFSSKNGNTASLGVNSIPGVGTNLNIKGSHNIYTSPDKTVHVNAVGEHNRPLSGNGRANTQVGVEAGINFR